MKTICSAALAAIILSIPAHGQGQVQFENYSIDAPIFGPDGNGLGPEARVQLFLDGMWLGGPATFEATVPGYFFGGVVETPGHPPGSRAVFHVRAWIGESYDTARIRGETVSEPTRLFQGGGAPPDTVRFESFTIPEPRVITLVLGGALLLLRRPSILSILSKIPGQPKHNLINNTHADHEQHLVVTRNQSVSE